MDIDECLGGADNCSDDATCTNSVGRFRRACNPGYIGDGVDCADIDECLTQADNCSEHASCANELGGFSCTVTPAIPGTA